MSLIYQGTKANIKQVQICKKDDQDIELGRGGQAIVYKGVVVIQQQDLFERQIDIALKRIRLPNCKLARQRVYELIKREQSVYRSIKSPHIIKLYGTNLNYQNTKLDDLEYLDFYFELCDGNLADLIIDTDTGNDLPLCEENALQIFEQVVEVEFLLEKSQFLRSNCIQQGLFHRDLNVKNILFKKKKNKIDIKLCDFGIANYINNQDNQVNSEIHLTQKIGTESYASPENKFSALYTLEKNETWSLGLLLFCLLKGVYYYKNNITLFNNKNEHLKLIEKLELQKYTKELLINLLQIDPNLRWGYDDIQQSKWYTLFGQNKCKILKKIQPILKCRQNYFNQLSIQLIEYDNFINQNNSLLQEFSIPQDLLIITLSSYQLWTLKQLEKYSGSYCYDYHSQDDQKNEIKRIETDIIKIIYELRDFFLQITQNKIKDQSDKNCEINQIIQYWSQIINKKTNITHFKPDALYYQTNLLEEIEQKLLSRLSIFSIQNNEKMINMKIKDPLKIKNQISLLQQLSKSFQENYDKEQQELENLEYQYSKSITEQQLRLFRGQVSIKQQPENQLDDKESEKLNKQKEVVEELKYQIDLCQVEINQKEKILQILEQKEILQKTLERLQKIYNYFICFFYWKRQLEYQNIFLCQD